MTRQTLVIVGAGLAGSILAAELCERFDVVVIELAAARSKLPTPVVDIGTPAGLDPHVGAGPGGTTGFWHNGLIELEETDFRNWPFEKRRLEPYYAKSYQMLGGAVREQLLQECGQMHKAHAGRGVPEFILGNCIFYPRRRRNLWEHLQAARKNIRRITGRAVRFTVDENGRATSLIVQRENGEEVVAGDVFICSAGGLSTPIVIANTAGAAALQLPAVGRYYHDHPMTWVAQIRLNLKLYDIWNHTSRTASGVLRLPFVIRGTTKYAFYVRPHTLNRRAKMKSVLTDLRNNPFNPANYIKLAKAGDDIVELLAFQFGINIPSRNFSVLMVAEQSAEDRPSVTQGEGQEIVRDWKTGGDFVDGANRAFDALIAAFGDKVEAVERVADWQAALQTAAHHSGTCRMGLTAQDAVCDENLKVFGTQNLFVCDGSVLPQSGYANTGLTIGALALKLADHLGGAPDSRISAGA